MKPIKIIGMGVSPRDLSAEHLEIIRQADILVGGKRHLARFKNMPAIKREITGDLKGMIRYLKGQRNRKSIVVLASGDPMFFGIGARLIDAFGSENVAVCPNISTVAAAFARLGIPWSDARIVTLHGRDQLSTVFDALREKRIVAIFTDPRHSPKWLAERLIANGSRNVDICVLEQMGYPEERVGWYSPSQAIAMRFSEPNLVVLKRNKLPEDKNRPLLLGTPDNWFEHERGLITKSEVRAVTLAKLRLQSDHVLWDLGAGSGSVAMEAALFVKRGKIFAIEQDGNRVEQIKKNKKRFQVKNLTVIHSVLPEGLTTLPKPDRVFIGGGGQRLKIIVQAACGRLAPAGIVVINTVLIENIEIARSTLKELGFDVDLVQIQVHRNRSMPWGERMEAQNPIWIISGMKKNSPFTPMDQ